MKRDPRLHGLSSDHHHALVLARRVLLACDGGRANARTVAELRARYEADLLPHFTVEEEVLLPALAAAGEVALVDKTLAEHAALRAHLAAAEAGAIERAAAFAALLTEHIRFEERELFPALERLPDAVLDEAARRAPKH